MHRIAIAVLISIVTAACSTVDVAPAETSAPTAFTKNVVTCEAATEPTQLTCGAAMTAVSTALGASGANVVSAEFHHANYCGNGRCRIPFDDEGYVIVTFANAVSVVAAVRVAGAGGVEVTSIQDKAMLDAGCPPTVASGYLIAQGGALALEVTHGGAIIPVRWSLTLSTRPDAGRLTLTDMLGRVLAHEGDFAMISGEQAADGGWIACGAPQVTAVPRDQGTN